MPKPKRAGKVKDKWREKRWVTVLASPSFERAPIAYIPITSNELAIGRVIETTLFDITKQDPQQNMLIKLHFQISSIEGNTATTILKGHEYSREYLRSLVRRGASMVNFIRDYRTKDNAVVRVYVVAFTFGRINSSRKHEIRLVTSKIISERTQSMVYEQFAQEAVKQTLSRELYDACKEIAKIRHLGIRKIKLIKGGDGMAYVPASGDETEDELKEEIDKAEAAAPEIAA
ncbi:MAG: 30S ribosomal protein S3ae [Nitrososphaerota archaeon]|jgi:small subunit ribosomal protein S3Ae|nr:30S ribosomal protein S3ae [Nitrososphaerota archaeon]